MQFDIPVSPSRDELVGQFLDPPLEYGLYPGWWWEGEVVCKEKITWQLEEMKKIGTAGTFFYMRYTADEPFAVNPAYRSDEFFELFRFSLEEHQRLGMEAYFSEWTGQRSIESEICEGGTASAELAGRRLVLHEAASKAAGAIEVEVPAGEEVLSAGAYKVVGNGLDGGSRVELLDTFDGSRVSWEAPGAGWLLAVVSSCRHGVNWLNHKVADRWLEKTYKPFLENVPEFFGKTLMGYIQDELDVLEGEIVYSPELLAEFITEKGYDPRAELVGLFYDIGGRTEKIRCEYHGKVADMIEKSVYERISRWHEDRGMIYGTIAIRGRQDVLGETGHFGDLFKLLRWYHFPGNEDPHVTAKTPDRRRFIDGKISSSGAHIFERHRAGLCAYWGTGWGMTMEDNISYTNENYAYGMNLYDPHLAAYSMGNSWYEWVPPTFYFFQPYWSHYKMFSDYVRRMSYVMSQGVHVADVAVLFPTATIHANMLRGNRVTLAGDMAACATFNMAESIYDGGIDFDFIDEDHICAAEVVDGKLCVSGISFRAVTLPPMTAIHIATLRKLKELYDDGGVVLAYQGLPTASVEKGRDDPEVRELLMAMFGTPSSCEYTHATLGPPDPHEDQFIRSIAVRQNEKGGVALFMPGEQNGRTNGSAIDLPSALASVMQCDVRTSVKDVYHTHQKVGELDVYFLHNARAEAREVTVTLRVVGEPELWNASTGEVTACHRYEHRDGTTIVRLSMERYAGVILSFAPVGDRASVVEDNLTEVTSVVAKGERVEVGGTFSNGGKKAVRVRHDGNEYVGEVRVDEAPTAITLDGEWGFCLKPTMDNCWGDYRYPKSETFVGAEARRFKYMEEGEECGRELGWHEAGFSDANWPVCTHSHGPYWYGAGPFVEGAESAAALAEALAGDDLSAGWQRYDFSERYGHAAKEIHDGFGGIDGVSDYFMFFEEVAGKRDVSRYLATTVYAEEKGERDFVFGCEGEVSRRAWVNGREVVSEIYDYAASRVDEGPKLPSFAQAPSKETAAADETRVSVLLEKGLNRVVIALVQPRGDSVRAYAAFLMPGANPSAGKPPIPRVRWFLEPTGLTFDILGEREKHVGWYRFEAPAGVATITIPFDGLGIGAWVDGVSVAVDDGVIRLASPSDKICNVALRIEQRPACYAGAAIPEPIGFECKPTRMLLGDWCDHALESYSGGAVYSKQFTLDAKQLAGKVVLDLGRVNVSAGVCVNGHDLGVVMARPFCFDLTEHVRVGSNDLEVTVYNTLANHYSIGIPSRFVYEGQTVSGLLGPVEVRFLGEVTVLAERLI